MDMSGQAIIEDDVIVIRLPIVNLPAVLEGSWLANGIDTRFKVTDPAAFAESLVYELNTEDDNGSNRIHKMFDRAINDAIDQGALGVDEHEDQDGDE